MKLDSAEVASEASAAPCSRVLNVALLDPSPEDEMLLRTVAPPDRYRFLPFVDDEAMESDSWDPAAFFRRVVDELGRAPTPCDGVIAFDDYPFSLMASALGERLRLRVAPLTAALLCQHKLWSRVSQMQVVPEAVPDFQLIDPRRRYRPSDLALSFPFWLKPVKSYMSYLGFKIRSFAELERASRMARAELPVFTRAFNFLLDKAGSVASEDFAEADGQCMIAEQYLVGRQCTVEGFVDRGRVRCLGVVDSIRLPNRVSFKRFDYPSAWPRRLQQQMFEIVERFVRHIGFDNSLFNAEFFYDPARGRPMLIEVNSRFSPQFSDMFEKVDGTSTLQIMLELATGQTPRFVPRNGAFKRASSFVLRSFVDRLVRRLPAPDDIERVAAQVPGTVVRLRAIAGKNLSEARQDSYTFRYAIVNVGADDRAGLEATFERARRLLNFEFTDPA